MATNAPSTASRALLTPRALLRGRSWLGGVLAAFMLLFVVFGAPLQASAHDRLVSSDPAADSVVTTAPATVTLTFSDTILKVGSAIQVNDAAGKNWAEGELGIVGTALTTGVAKGMPNGAFTIVWRAVSSDGHPIEGQIPFKVELAAASAAAETPSAAAETTTASPAAAATSAATSAAATSSAAASNATASATMAPTAAPNPDATKDNESLGVPTPVLTGGSIPGIQGTPADIPGQNASSGVNPIYYWLFALLVVIAIVLIVRAVRARDEDNTQASAVEAAATTPTPTTSTSTTSSAASVATTSAGVNPVQKPGTDTANHAATATSAAAKPNAEAATNAEATTNAETVAAAEPAAPRARRASSPHPPVSAPVTLRGRRASNRVDNDEQKPQ